MQLVRLSAGLTLVLETWRLCVLLRLSFDAIARQVAVDPDAPGPAEDPEEQPVEAKRNFR